MANELTKREAMLAKLDLGLELGSLKSLVRDATEVIFLLVDTSGSMSSAVVRKGGFDETTGFEKHEFTRITVPGLDGAPPREINKRSIDSLREVVNEVQSRGKLPMIAFGGPYNAQVRFVDDVPEPAGGTPLHLAIPLAKQYGANRLVIISDGCPDLREQCLIEAKSFGGQIDVVFCGSGDGWDTTGAAFLEQLAKETGGTRLMGDFADVKSLTGKVIGLLEGDVPQSSTIIQGEGFSTVDAPVVEEVGTSDDDEDEEEDDEDEEEDDDDEE